jgi:hypothetical protein
MEKVKHMFSIKFVSDLDYEEMVADICFDNHTVVMVSQEEGINDMEIELYGCQEYGKPLKFPLEGFMRILADAKTELAKYSLDKNDDSQMAE